MAFPTSYVNGKTVSDALTNAIALNLDTDTVKVALFTDSVTGADKNATESYASGTWASNEVSSANYTAGGSALTNPGVAVAAGVLTFDDSAATLAWSNVTFTCRGCLVYDDTLSPKRAIAAINFGSNLPVTAGDFTITWDGTYGIFYATY